MDNSWDNGGGPTRKKSAIPWAKLATGSAIALLLVLGGAGGVYWLTQNQDRIERFGREQAKGDWAEAGRITEALRTPEGAIALYRRNPRLGKTFPTDQDFLKAAALWRPHLEALPAAVPSPEEGRFGHRMGFGGMGEAIISFRMENGTWIRLSWNGQSSNTARQLVEIGVIPGCVRR